jgi:malate dehydrogenase (oxaloacetate-decarboxylating)(NADP+)
VDAAICGGSGNWMNQWHYAFDIVGKRPDVEPRLRLSAVIIPSGTLFFVDTHLLLEPTAEQLAEMTCLAAEQVRAFGITPKAALLSHSSFGASGAPSARKMREALRLIRDRAPDFEVDGEMHADAALVPAIRARAVPDSPLTENANLLVMPTLDAANISFNLLKAAADGLQVGPILLGMRKPIHVLVPSVTARGIVNLTALAAAQANGLTP